MNYLNFKSRYPKSINKFFCWVAENPEKKMGYENNVKIEYVDNVYFYEFFENIFNSSNKVIYIEEKKHIDVLKPLLIKTRHIDNDYWGNESKILFGKYRDTGKDFISIRINEESDYENVFYILEILINKGLYA